MSVEWVVSDQRGVRLRKRRPAGSVSRGAKSMKVGRRSLPGWVNVSAAVGRTPSFAEKVLESMNDFYTADNASERERLIRVTARLSDEDLRRQLPNGWSVATTLVHLAFWDTYYLALLKGWERSGCVPSSVDFHAINEAVRILGNAIPAQATVQLVQAAAEAIDRHLEGIPPELRAAIETSGRFRILKRALHRREHLDQIESALAT
jgi:hypothetical protein